MGIYYFLTLRETPWWVYYLFHSPERHPGGYTHPLTPREAPWWVYTPFNTQRGTLVGILPLYTQRGTLVGILPVIHPERHPGGYMPPYYTLLDTMVGVPPCIYPPVYTVCRQSCTVHTRSGTPCVCRARHVHRSGCRMCRFDREVNPGRLPSEKRCKRG